MENYAQQNGVVPPALLSKPDQADWMMEYSKAFYVLNPSRPTGMGLGFIPLSAIWTYVQMFGEPVHGREVFVYLINLMDQAFVSEMGKKNVDKR